MFDEFAGVHIAERPETPPKVDLNKYTGSYKRLGIDMELKGTGPLASLAPPQTAVGRPIDKEIFLINISGTDTIGQFMDFDRTGRPRYLHVGGRVSKRVADGAKAKPAKARTATRKKPAKSKARKQTAARRGRR